MTNAWPILALLAPVLTGCFLVGAVAGSTRSAWASATRIIAGAGIGFAVASGLYFLWRAAGAEMGIAYRIVDCLLLPVIAAAAYLYRRRDRASPPHSIPQPPSTLALLIPTLLVGIVAVIAAAKLALDEPAGNWDANAIWNLKARFLHRGAGDAWMRMFDKEIWFSHPDYPLLLPAAVARLWSYAGRETHVVPIALGLGFTSLCLALLFTALATLRGLVAACAGALLLCANEIFLWYGGAQVADVPLAFFILSAVVFLTLGWQRADRGSEASSLPMIALAGACAGLGAFVKNEGLAICAILALACASVAVISRQYRPLAALLIGMVITLSLVATQKLLFAGESYLTADQPSSAAIIEKLLDPQRHRTILAFLGRWYFGLREWYSPVEGWRLNQWPIPMVNEPAFLLLLAIPLVFGLRLPPARRPPAIAVGGLLILVILAYYAVLLVMPYDLSVLVQSLPRYYLHIVPSAIFWVCFVTRWPRTENRRPPMQPPAPD